jgi:hypothetical protein
MVFTPSPIPRPSLSDNPSARHTSIRFTREENPPDEEEPFLVNRLKKTRQRNHEFQTARRR